MKSVLLAVMEEQHDKRSWRANAVIGTFLLISVTLSFSVRQQSALAKDAILTYNSKVSSVARPGQNVEEVTIDPDRALFLFTAAVAAAQVLITGIVLTLDYPSVKGDLPDKEALVIVAIAHAGSTLLRDFLTEINVSTNNPITVQDVAYFYPVLALAALWIVTSVPARPLTWVSLFMVGFGCSMMATRAGVVPASASSVAASNRAALVCGLVFFAAAMRNIVLRQLVHCEGVEVKSRPLPPPYNRMDTWTAAAGFGAFGVLTVFLVAPEGWGLAALCGAISCVLSSALFLVTTQVLKVYGVTSTALFSVWALLLEALVSTPIPFRPTLLSCFLALGLLAVGHWLHLRNLSEPEGALAGSGSVGGSGAVGTGAGSTGYYRKPAGIHEQYTRLEFLLFASAVVGVIFYVFQPRVSQRDLNTLSYVGLDKVIRRLLSVSTGAEHESGLASKDEPDDSHAAHAVSMS
ncbi:hypothetical protein PoB_004734600 [Plakobranchus ocellatus]|uniref:Transmembrane protein n=1 Tax=Plakobranchus ocellatus TaxID=259542 RepID=A0AAV4BKC5_9GAST|nr:hypothetical protein PoB_004734600 [Plakobranchus ocellatus]